MSAFALPTLTRTPLAAFIRRHRRIVAAACAGLAALIAVSLVRSPAPVASTPTAPVLGAGELAVPVTLASAAVTSVVHPGDIVDIVRVPHSGYSGTSDAMAQVVASSVRVLSVGSDSGFGASSSPILLAAMPRTDALAIADAGSDGGFTIWLHGDESGGANASNR